VARTSKPFRRAQAARNNNMTLFYRRIAILELFRPIHISSHTSYRSSHTVCIWVRRDGPSIKRSPGIPPDNKKAAYEQWTSEWVSSTKAALPSPSCDAGD
jgi:hypothetical protein